MSWEEILKGNVEDYKFALKAIKKMLKSLDEGKKDYSPQQILAFIKNVERGLEQKTSRSAFLGRD